MLTAIIILDPALRDALVGFVSGIKQTNTTDNVTFYQKNNFIFAFSDSHDIRTLYTLTLEEYQPENVFIADIGRSVGMDHEVGDIVLPNIFFSFSEKVLEEDTDSVNRDHLIGKAKFLEIFDEYKDYFVEDYGLSVGGIVVENTPNTDEINEKLMAVYEADVYSEKSLAEVHAIIAEDAIPTLFITGIVQWKANARSNKSAEVQVAENMMTTIRLINDEESL